MKGLEPRVFIQQAAKTTKSSDKIVSSLVFSIEDLRGDLATDEYDYLKELDLRKVVMRGAEVSPDGRNEKTWATMEIGDIALIAWRGHIEAVGEIVLRKRSSNPKHDKFRAIFPQGR